MRITLILLAAVMLLSSVGRADDAAVILRYDFDSGDTQGAEANGGGKLELTDDTFDGSGGALKATCTGDYPGVSWYQRTPIQENNSFICFAYKVAGINGDLMVQCQSAAAGNLHAAVKPTVQGEWAIAVVDLGKLVDWGGKYKDSKGHAFRNIQIYSGRKGDTAVLYIDNVVIGNGIDREPPAAVQDLNAGIEDYRIRLAWPRAADTTFAALYEVYRGTAPAFTPEPANLVGRTPHVFIQDDTISNFGTFYYRVRAVDVSGNTGPFSDALRLKVADTD